MKIGIDLRPLLNRKASGVATYTRALVTEMLKHKDHEFVLFLSGRKPEYEKILDEFDCKNKVFWRVSNRALNFGFWFLGFPRVDLGVDAMFLPDMRPIRLKKGVKKVVTCHDLSFLRFPQFFSRKSRFWYFLNNPKKYFKSADKVISVSRFTQKELKKLCGVESEVVYEGVYMPEGEDAYDLPEKYLLSLCTLEPRKNLKRMIEAYFKADLEEVLVIAGDFDKKIFADLKLPISRKVHFIGSVDPEHKRQLYKEASGLVYVSLYEGFGLPPLEALSQGTPVLTSEGSPMEEVCGDQAIYVDPEDVSAISEGMRELVSRKWNKEKLTARAGEFSWKKAAEEVICLCSDNH